MSYPFSFLNSSLCLAGGKHYPKITLPLSRDHWFYNFYLILQNIIPSVWNLKFCTNGWFISSCRVLPARTYSAVIVGKHIHVSTTLISMFARFISKRWNLHVSYAQQIFGETPTSTDICAQCTLWNQMLRKSLLGNNSPVRCQIRDLDPVKDLDLVKDRDLIKNRDLL